jgi:hypothetical protein
VTSVSFRIVQNKTDGDNPKSGGKIPDLPNRLKTTTHKVGDGEWGDILNTSQIGEPSCSFRAFQSGNQRMCRHHVILE